MRLTLAIAALAAVVLTACVDDAPGTEDVERDERGAVTEAGTVGSQKLRVGDCFLAVDDAQMSSVDVVPCSEPHVYEAYFEFDVVAPDGGDEWPGDTLFQERAGQMCIGPNFADYVGTDFAESRFEISFIWPTEDTWNGYDDRRVLCLLVLPGEADATGSAAGSAS